MRGGPAGSQRKLFPRRRRQFHPRAATAGRRRTALRFQPLDSGLGQFTENIRFIAPDQTTVLRKGETKFELRDPALHTTSVMVFGNIEFKAAGNYFVEVMVDDVMKLRYPVAVIHAPPPGQNPQNPPEEKKA